MVMDGFYVQDKLPALWHKIDQLHLSYLEMEESPQKLDQRTKLEECINDYLCLAPHNQKFYFQETAQVLHRSASTKKDFSGYKAATGWHAIQMYAGNLLAQPWRKEYRQINMYSGFYIHNIEANLVGAEIMFEIMGYKHANDSVLVLEGPICPDRVANVSKDALLAYVECQILKAIWEEVSANFPISWLDVLEFRESHLCSPKHSIQSLNYRLNQKQYMEQARTYSQASDMITNNLRHPPVSLHNTLPALPMNHSFPPLSGHSHVPPTLPAPCVFANNSCCNNVNYATYAPVVSHYAYPTTYTYAQPVKPQYNANGYCCPNGYATVPSNYGCPVPTGQLIELESQPISYDTVDSSRQARNRSGSYQNILNDASLNRNLPHSNGETEKENTFENWDYVYKNLESQGYSKDLGERGDVLSPSEIERNRQSLRDAKKLKSTNIDEVMNNLTMNDRPLKMNEALEKYKENDRDKRKTSVTEPKRPTNVTPTSSYENLSTHDAKKASKAAPSGKVSVKIKFLSRDKFSALGSSVSKLTQNRSLDIRKSKTQQEDRDSKLREAKGFSEHAAVEEASKWQCKACTYLNDDGNDICEMCSKSKVAVEQQMEIGGSQCPQCTLVNPRDVKVCEACGTSLKDSPTYI